MGPGRPITGDSIESFVHHLDSEYVEQTIKTIEEFNAACYPGKYDPGVRNGNDTEGIDRTTSNWALSIDEPRFTGYPVTRGMTFAFGGVAINPDAEVLDTRDKSIPRLIADTNSFDLN